MRPNWIREDELQEWLYGVAFEQKTLQGWSPEVVRVINGFVDALVNDLATQQAQLLSELVKAEKIRRIP